jgi:hypothetical protein
MTGRCAGCGKTGQPAPLRRHVVECPDWLALPPGRQVEPVAEYRRWLDEDRESDYARHREQVIISVKAARAVAGARFARSRDLDALLDEEDDHGRV